VLQTIDHALAVKLKRGEKSSHQVYGAITGNGAFFNLSTFIEKIHKNKIKNKKNY